MAAFTINHVRLYGTYAEMIAYTGPKARGNEFLVTDYGVGAGLIFEWNGAAWVLPGYEQLVARTATAVAASGTTETTLLTVTIPPLGINDTIRLQTGINFTNPGAATEKQVRVRLAGTQVWSNNFNNSNHLADVRDIFIRNRGATNSQVSGHNNANVYGTGAANLSTSAIQTNVATSLTVVGHKVADTNDVISLQFADVFVYGGTARP